MIESMNKKSEPKFRDSHINDLEALRNYAKALVTFGYVRKH